MRRATLCVPVFLMLCGVAAKADQVGPTWDITAAGIFSGGGPGSEAFALQWTLTFQSFSPGAVSVMPVWNGTTVFTGVLGTFTDIVSNQFTNVADFGFVGMSDPQNDEIDFPVSDQNVITLAQTATPPSVGLPYLYSCNVPSICAAYGTHVGIGLFSGQGTITENVKEIPAATPEPGPFLLLIATAMVVGVRRLVNLQIAN